MHRCCISHHSFFYLFVPFLQPFLMALCLGPFLPSAPHSVFMSHVCHRRLFPPSHLLSVPSCPPMIYFLVPWTSYKHSFKSIFCVLGKTHVCLSEYVLFYALWWFAVPSIALKMSWFYFSLVHMCAACFVHLPATFICYFSQWICWLAGLR